MLARLLPTASAGATVHDPGSCTSDEVPMKTRISRSSAAHASASLNLDVTRLEHENLYEPVSELLEAVRR